MGSYFTSKQALQSFMAKPGERPAMNQMVGFSAVGLTDPSVSRLLPPQLQLSDPKNPLFYLYGARVEHPTFSQWYYEAGLGLFARYEDLQGIYYLNLQLSGPGAEMATYLGRENAGIPKKLAEEIRLERQGEQAVCVVRRQGVELCRAKLSLGRYDLPLLRQPQEDCSPEKPICTASGSFYYKYDLSEGFHDLRLQYHAGTLQYNSWEKAQANINLSSTEDDPWGEIPIRQTLMAGWMTCDSSSQPPQTLCQIPKEETADTMQYLFAGRFDQSTICRNGALQALQP